MNYFINELVRHGLPRWWATLYIWGVSVFGGDSLDNDWHRHCERTQMLIDKIIFEL